MARSGAETGIRRHHCRRRWPWPGDGLISKLHGVTNVAVLEKGYLGGGNTGRNTTIVRSNYMGRHAFMRSRAAMEVSQDLNFNVMMSQRASSIWAFDAQMTVLKRAATRCVSMASMLISWTVTRSARSTPFPTARRARFPIYGVVAGPGRVARRCGCLGIRTGRGQSRHRSDPELRSHRFIKEGERVVGVETTRTHSRQEGRHHVAGHAGHLAAKAGLTLPIGRVLQAFVSSH